MKYNVHLYALVRVKVEGVEANNMLEDGEVDYDNAKFLSTKEVYSEPQPQQA